MEPQFTIADGRYLNSIVEKSIREMRYIGILVARVLSRQIHAMPDQEVYQIFHNTLTVPHYAGLYAYGDYDSLVQDVSNQISLAIKEINRLEPRYNPSFQLQLYVDWLQLTIHCTLKEVTVLSSSFFIIGGTPGETITDYQVAATQYKNRLRAEIGSRMRAVASHLSQL